MRLGGAGRLDTGLPARQAELRQVCRAAASYLLDEESRPNVVGVAAGCAHRGGRATGQLALLVLVTRKVAAATLPPAGRVPGRICGYRTDVVEVGSAGPPAAAVLGQRWPRAYGGCAVGHGGGTVGTMAAVVHRHGEPGWFLSTNHVLADLNRGGAGDPVLQPSRFDGGRLPSDEIGRLDTFVPIELDPPVARRHHENVVDAALARVTSPRVVPGVRGFTRLASAVDQPLVGTEVRKTGRATGTTTGRIIAVAATVDIRYGRASARFHDQIVTTAMMAPGDSGALLVTDHGAPVGLLFAGSAAVSFANPIGRVYALLGIEVAG